MAPLVAPPCLGGSGGEHFWQGEARQGALGAAPCIPGSVQGSKPAFGRMASHVIPASVFCFFKKKNCLSFAVG